MKFKTKEIKKILIIIVTAIIFSIMIINEYYRSKIYKSYKDSNKKIILTEKIVDSLKIEIYKLKKDIIIIKGCPYGK